jgi:hypothetical protein
LSEQTVELSVEEAYRKLKDAFLKEGCTILSEEPPNQLSVRQGSLWGISPATAKKTVNATFEPIEGAKTRVHISSKIASNWKNITLVGCVLAVVLAGVCLWMATDLGTFLATGQSSVWSWLVTSQGTVESQTGYAFVNLTIGLAVFLFTVVALEAAIYLNVHRKINTVAERCLNRS